MEGKLDMNLISFHRKIQMESERKMNVNVNRPPSSSHAGGDALIRLPTLRVNHSRPDHTALATGAHSQLIYESRKTQRALDLSDCMVLTGLVGRTLSPWGEQQVQQWLGVRNFLTDKSTLMLFTLASKTSKVQDQVDANEVESARIDRKTALN